jgi:dipeptidyl aminopeptidase/acylaminoacyl peptidase
VVHGGPAWFSADYLLISEDRAYYPSIQFVNKGVLVLKPNYRGSIGRGQAFLDLNVDYLSGSLFRDRERYLRTVPISNRPTPARRC